MRLDEIVGKTMFGETFKLPEINTEIWIADDVHIACRAKYKWWQVWLVRLFFGWKVTKVKKPKINISGKVGIDSCMPTEEEWARHNGIKLPELKGPWEPLPGKISPTAKLEITDMREKFSRFVHEEHFQEYLSGPLTFEGLYRKSVDFPLKGREVIVEIKKYTPINLEVQSGKS